MNFTANSLTQIQNNHCEKHTLSREVFNNCNRPPSSPTLWIITFSAKLSHKDPPSTHPLLSQQRYTNQTANLKREVPGSWHTKGSRPHVVQIPGEDEKNDRVNDQHQHGMHEGEIVIHTGGLCEAWPLCTFTCQTARRKLTITWPLPKVRYPPP